MVLIAPGVEALTGVADKAVHIDVPSRKRHRRRVRQRELRRGRRGSGHRPGRAHPFHEGSGRQAGRPSGHGGHHRRHRVPKATWPPPCTFGGVGQRKSKANGTAIYTVGAGVFDEASASGTTDAVEEALSAAWLAPCAMGTKDLLKSDVDLAAAGVVVAGGRGFAEEADLQLMRDVAAKLGGECGCSRPLAEGVDWMPREAYIGVSGMMLALKVYLGIGISGQMQHMVGVNRAGADVRREQGQERPDLQAVRLRPRGRPQGRPAEAGGGSVSRSRPDPRVRGSAQSLRRPGSAGGSQGGCILPSRPTSLRHSSRDACSHPARLDGGARFWRNRGCSGERKRNCGMLRPGCESRQGALPFA